MGLQDDFNEFAGSSGTKRDYLRLIWDETELVASDFDSIDYLDDPDTIRRQAMRCIEKNDRPITHFRRNMYEKFLQNEAFPAWLERLIALTQENDDIAKNDIAKYLTRLLRGEGCGFHRTLDDSHSLLMQKNPPLDVWENCFTRLKNLCDASGIR